MPKVNVYLSEELLEKVRQSNIHISETCQKAFKKAIEKRDEGKSRMNIALKVECICGAESKFKDTRTNAVSLIQLWERLHKDCEDQESRE